MIRLVISGCCGKMGRRIMALGLQDKRLRVVGALEAQNHRAVGKSLTALFAPSAPPIKVTASPRIIKEADVVIEFTNPQATLEHLALAVKWKKAMVIGTTGLEEEQLQKIKQASSRIPLVFSPNMSVGVNLVFRLVKEAAQKLGEEYRVDIEETHHVHKKDAPSGTAKRLAQLIQQAPARQNQKIDIRSIREGEIVGEHQIRFDSPQDSIVIRHSAKTRDIFAQGALQAARFVCTQKPGLYDMQDVLNKI